MAGLRDTVKIRVDKGTTRIWIDGVEVSGFIMRRACDTCKHKLQIYHDKYDAVFCPWCNEWKEKACSDPKCDFCSNRPPTPL